MQSGPLLFTIDFRRKMAELTPRERQEWLASLAVRFRREPTPALAQELAEVSRGCRLALLDSVERLGEFDRMQLRALLEVPRERFVRPEDLERSAEDVPLPLDDAGLATISAPHAYLLSFRSNTARHGFFEEDGELWSANGILLAQSRQLALLLDPAG